MPAREREHLHIGQDVHDHLKNQQDIEAVQLQKKWFLEQVEIGNRSLNVISSPLYKYQEEGVLHLAFGRRVLLADDMGLGKTIQAIAAAALLQATARHPARARSSRPRRSSTSGRARFNALRRCRSRSSRAIRLDRRNQYRQPQFFNIVNYELALYDQEEIVKQQFDLIILDEAQRIKNWRTKTADAIKQLRSPYAFVLTGTPLENRLDELYSVFQFIDPTHPRPAVALQRALL